MGVRLDLVIFCDRIKVNIDFVFFVCGVVLCYVLFYVNCLIIILMG